MPTIYREGPFRFFFNSREESRLHVHVESTEGLAKFWLEPIVALAVHHRLNAPDLARIENIVKEHRDDFIAAWRAHLG
ncbi:MAG: DUF4160 domain-containing protein [Acidobacteriota bacterium]